MKQALKTKEENKACIKVAENVFDKITSFMFS
jgi:hypothetical protein